MKVIPRSIKQVLDTLNRLTRVSCLLGPLREFHRWNFLPRVLDGCYSLARDIKSVLFSLGALSSCRESPVHLCIKRTSSMFLTLQILDKSSPLFDWTNQVHKSTALTDAFPFKKEICINGLKYPLIKCFSNLVNPAGFNPNRSALEF